MRREVNRNWLSLCQVISQHRYKSVMRTLPVLVRRIRLEQIQILIPAAPMAPMVGGSQVKKCKRLPQRVFL